jgi:phosphoserine phosphatase
MLETLDKARKLQVEADDAHQKYLETKQQAQQIHQKCVELVEKIKTFERELKENADKKQAERQGELQKELEERALAKLKRGEKLMWEEFKILAEKGIL